MANATDTSRELKGIGQSGQKALTDLLVQFEQDLATLGGTDEGVGTVLSNIQADIAALGTAFSSLTAKLDADATVTDEDYNTLNPTLNYGAE